MTTFSTWVQTSKLMQRMVAEEDDAADWSDYFHGLWFMTEPVIDLFNHVMSGGGLRHWSDHSVENMQNALHTANYIESPFMLNILILDCIKHKKNGNISDLPSFVPVCILQDRELKKCWTGTVLDLFGSGSQKTLSKLDRIWSDTVFWETDWQKIWTRFYVDETYSPYVTIANRQFQWMCDKGIVQALNYYPLDEEWCPVYRLLIENYSTIDGCRLIDKLLVPDWLPVLLQSVPQYLLRKVRSSNERRDIDANILDQRNLIEIIILSGQYNLLRCCIDHVPEDTRTSDNLMLMDISLSHESNCFDILTDHGFLPSDAIWERVVTKALVQRYFITNEIHWLTSMPGVPLIPPQTSLKIHQFLITYEGHSTTYSGNNVSRIYTQLKYLYNWNVQRHKENNTV